MFLVNKTERGQDNDAKENKYKILSAVTNLTSFCAANNNKTTERRWLERGEGIKEERGGGGGRQQEGNYYN